LLVRFVFGILLSLNTIAIAQAQEWQRLGPPGGMVLTLGLAAGGGVYLGTADGHVFFKENSEKPWELRGRIGNRTDAVVSQLVGDHSKANVVFAAIWYQHPGAGGGVFRSEDGARTWRPLGLQNEAVRALEIAPAPSRIMLAGSRSGVFRSSDYGTSWERITPADDPELRNVDSLAIDPRDADAIYTGTYHLPWKSTDGGKSWQPATAGLIDDSDIMSLRIDATNPERVFLSACSGIYRSENRGRQWSKLQGIPYAARRTQAIVQDSRDSQTLYAGTTEGLWVTRDGGESWERTTPKDWVVNTVAVLTDSRSGSERVLVGTESRGVEVSDDAGRTFVGYNDGFTHQIVRQLIGDQLDPAHLLSLMYRDGALLWESRNAGDTWIPVTTTSQGSTGKARIVPETIERLYASPWGWMARQSSGQFWILRRGTAKWQQWKLRLAVGAANPHNLAKTTQQSAGAPTAISVVPAVGGIEFSAQDAYVPSNLGLLRCTVDGECVRLGAFGPKATFTALSVSPDGLTLHIVADGKLAISGDQGQTVIWSDLPVFANHVLSITASNAAGSPALFLETIDGLYSSTDEGKSWIRRERGLPAGQIEQLIQGRAFIAASLRDGGMYVSFDLGDSWVRASQDDERSRLMGMVETTPGVLAIGSQSEGVLRWQVKSKKQ
jgi:photosystem II stability/assembly factor-like uncharacterized protein